MKLAPIVLFVYNRSWHTMQTVEALKKNKLAEKSGLFIFSDGPKSREDELKVKEVREYIRKIKDFKSIKIIKRKKNLGLANSVIRGVTEIINKYGEVIVLEDDVITSEFFLEYANFLLNKYKTNKPVFSITGYNPPKKLMKIPKNYDYDIYFSPRAGAQVWATWKDRWEKADWEVKDFDEFLKNKELQKRFNYSGGDMADMLISQMEGKIDSWAIRWCYAHFKNNALCIYPTKSYINNIGFDGSGVHSGKSKKYKIGEDNLNMVKIPRLPKKLELNSKLMNNFRKVYKTKIFQTKIFKLIKNMKLYKFYRKTRYKK